MTSHKVTARAEARNLVVTTRAAIKEMKWLKPSDAPMVELAVTYAMQIEQAAELLVQIKAGMSLVLEDPDSTSAERLEAARLLTASSADLQKAVGWIGPHLVNALKALGASPLERRALVGEDQINGRLAHLRSARPRSAPALDSSAS